MSKEKNPRRVADNEAMAKSKMLRTSPQKLNLVAAMIRGKKVDKALADLTFSKKRIAEDVKKCLQSAIANAENNHGLDVDGLGRRRGLCRQEPHDEAWPSAGTWPLRQDHETVQRADHQGAASRGASVMGQKVNPIGMRLQVNRTWDSRWYADMQGIRQPAA